MFRVENWCEGLTWLQNRRKMEEHCDGVAVSVSSSSEEEASCKKWGLCNDP